jgi:alpha-mannosidase
VQFADHVRGRVIEDLMQWESLIDAGDEYTPSLRGGKFAPVCTGTRVVHTGPVRATLETRWLFRERRQRVTARVHLTVDASAPFLRISVGGINAATDHRLRLRVATDVRAPRVVADAMFGPVERPALQVPAGEAKMETPLRTAPLHRYVSLFESTRGATLFSDGLCEYEADDAGGMFVTLLRAVGELSRADLPERPGNAGWPASTPGAQCPGPFAAELALLLHGARTDAVIDEIERTADDVLLPLTGATLRSALHVPPPISGITLSGNGLAFGAMKQSEEPGWIALRCVNLHESAREGVWTLGRPVVEARRARLDETPGEVLVPEGNAVRFAAGPREAVTILIR